MAARPLSRDIRSKAKLIFWHEHAKIVAEEFTKQERLKPYQRKFIKLVETLNKAKEAQRGRK